MPEHFNEMIKMNALHDEKFNPVPHQAFFRTTFSACFSSIMIIKFRKA